jgi:hypothetical protein
MRAVNPNKITYNNKSKCTKFLSKDKTQLRLSFKFLIMYYYKRHPKQNGPKRLKVKKLVKTHKVNANKRQQRWNAKASLSKI